MHRKLLTLYGLALVFSFLLFNVAFDDSTDAGRYYAMGQSLYHTGHLSEYYLSSQPLTTNIPPGLPGIIALTHILFGPSWIPSQGVIFFFYLLALLVLFFYALFSFDPGKRLFSFLLLLSFNVSLIGYSHSLKTEIPYLLSSLFSIYSLKRYTEIKWVSKSREAPYPSPLPKGRGGHWKIQCFWVYSILGAAIACYFRPIGITLLLAISSYLFFIERKRKEAFLWGGLALGCLMPWIIRNFLIAHTPTGHLNDFMAWTPGVESLIKRILHNIASFAGIECGMVFIQGFSHTLFRVGATHVREATLISLFLFGFILVGFWKALFPKEEHPVGWRQHPSEREKFPFHEGVSSPEGQRGSINFNDGKTSKSAPLRLEAFYTLFYYGLYFIWPSEWRDYRFDLVMLPFLALYLILGLQAVLEWLKVRQAWIPKIVLGCVGLIVLNNLTFAFPEMLTRWPNNIRYLQGDKLAPYPDYFKPYVAAALFARDHIPGEVKELGSPEVQELRSREVRKSRSSGVERSRSREIQKSKVSNPNPLSGSPQRLSPSTPIFLTSRPSVWFALSGHKAMEYPFTQTETKLWKFCKKNQITYIVSDTIYPDSIRYLQSALHNIPLQHFKIIFENKKVQLLQLVHPQSP